MNMTKQLTRALAIIGLVIPLVSSPAIAAQPASGSSLTYPGMLSTVDRSDSAIKDDVKRTLEKYKDVHIKVDKRVVTLSGEVHSDAQRHAAIEETRSIPGVHSVQDQIQITSTASQSAGEYLDDATITASVKSKILAEKGLSTLKISVDTDNGVVTLTGSADSKSHVDLAGQVAQSVKGVKRVNNKLLVKP